MSILTVSNLHHSYGSHAVLRGASFTVDASEKIGLVGRNGSGKTTLLRAMLGVLKPDAGAVQLARTARMGYLTQDPDLDRQMTVRDAAESAFKELHDLHQQMHEVYDQMASAQSDELDRLMKRQATLEGRIEAAGGYAIDHRIDAMLHDLGFTDAQFELPVAKLSGGQKGRLGLARLLLEEPDVLFLDEPTNHLDIHGRKWLETFLVEQYPGAVIIVSHDRWLLDRVVSRIIEVEQGMIREYPGNYQKYLELRRERQMTQARVYDKQLDRIRAEEQYIRKYKAGQRAKQARGRQSRLERFKQQDLVERPMELDVMRLSLPRASRSGDIVITAENISKTYDSLTLFEHLNMTVNRGDRIGIIGPNGVGKSTLIRCLLGEEPTTDGIIKQGSRLSVGYYKQSHEHLDMSLTVWQYLQSVIVSLDGSARATEQQARDLAGAFLFSGDEQDKLLADVSGGERSRAVLAGLVAGAHNVLVLDEPTNHLDIPSAERLEQAFAAEGGYDGTLLLITHDRALLQATCDRLIIFSTDAHVERRVTMFEGDYIAWEQREQQLIDQSALQRAASQKQQNDRKVNASARQKSAAATESHSDDNAKRPFASMSMSKLEARIESLQQRVKEIDTAMLDPTVYSDGQQCRALQEERRSQTDELTALEDEWLLRTDG